MQTNWLFERAQAKYLRTRLGPSRLSRATRFASLSLVALAMALVSLLAPLASAHAQSLNCGTAGANASGTVVGTNGAGDKVDTISVTNLASGNQVSLLFSSVGNNTAAIVLTNTGSGTFSSSSFTMPAGSVTTPATRTEAYTASSTGSHSITITMNETGNTASRTVNWTATCAGVPPTITTTSPLADATIGAPYSVTLAATGGTTPYTWNVTGGALPSPLSLSTSGV